MEEYDPQPRNVDVNQRQPRHRRSVQRSHRGLPEKSEKARRRWVVDIFTYERNSLYVPVLVVFDWSTWRCLRLKADRRITGSMVACQLAAVYAYEEAAPVCVSDFSAVFCNKAIRHWSSINAVEWHHCISMRHAERCFQDILSRVPQNPDSSDTPLSITALNKVLRVGAKEYNKSPHFPSP